MNMIILLALGFAMFVGGIVWAVYVRKLYPVLASLVGIVLLIIGASMHFVPSGYVGVRTAYGQISDKPAKSGMNWHVPFVEAIHNVNCKQQEKDLGEVKIWSETSERTEVYCQNVTVDYQINAEYASWIWTNVEEYDHNLVKQTSIESGIKAATKQYNDTDVTDRAKIEIAAKECVQKALNAKYNSQIVDIVSLTIGNINFSDAYNDAIEKKAQAKLSAETAEYANRQATQQKEAEAEQKKIEAEADAEVKRIKAQGEADAIKIKADAEAEANMKIAGSLTPILVENNKVNKWDGKLSIVSGSGAAIIDIGNTGVENEPE